MHVNGPKLAHETKRLRRHHRKFFGSAGEIAVIEFEHV